MTVVNARNKQHLHEVDAYFFLFVCFVFMQVVRGTTRPIFAHMQQFTFAEATQQLVHWLETGLISISV
jgi:hypothetical protein